MVSTGTSVWENEFYEDKVRNISEDKNEKVIYVLHTHPISFSYMPASKLGGGDIAALIKSRIKWVELATPYEDLFAPLDEFSEAEMWKTLGVEFKKWFEENKGKIKEYLF